MMQPPWFAGPTLTAFPTIFEKVMHKTVTEFLNSNNTLADEQFGFRDSL
jgi:hypothetical protein